MEIKHTIEILTKDIQDIEKLVGNLQLSQDGSTLELDLALSKLRNVYEILTMIREDMRDTRNRPARKPVSEPVAEAPPPEMPDNSIVEVVTEEPEKPGKKAEILAEKFSTQSSINENMAGQRGEHVDSKLMGQPIDNFSRNIGINDRFLIIRELFDGDADGFGKLMEHLDGAGNYQDAVSIIEKSFSDSMEHEGVDILVGLAKRRFSQD